MQDLRYNHVAEPSLSLESITGTINKTKPRGNEEMAVPN